MTQHVVAKGEFLIGPSGWVTSGTNSNSFENTASSQLTQDHGSLEFPSFFALVGLDAADIVDIGRVDGVHELDQRRLEDSSERRFAVHCNTDPATWCCCHRLG